MAKKKSTPSKSASRKPSPKKSASTVADEARGTEEVTIDRRRATEDSEEEMSPKLERRKKVQRRRQIDPTTCERDYSTDEIEFMNALDEYKRQSGRMFPTCSEVLEVIRGLGYVRLSPADLALLEAESLPEDIDDIEGVDEEEMAAAELSAEFEEGAAGSEETLEDAAV